MLFLSTRLGLTPGVVAFAGKLRTAGHITPDLSEGCTFPAFDDGGQDETFRDAGGMSKNELTVTDANSLPVRLRGKGWVPGPDTVEQPGNFSPLHSSGFSTARV